MSNHQEVIDLAKALTGNEHLYSVQPFIKITGDTMFGLFLERIVYWSDKSGDKKLRQLKIFYKSAEEWEDELGLSYAQITRARKDLEAKGFITTKTRKANGTPTTHYYANINAIKEAIITYYQGKASDYANLNISEIQESSISENEGLQVEETQETIEIQESPTSSYNSSNPNHNSSKDSSSNEEGGKPQENSKSPLEPETEGELLLFEKINRNRDAKRLRAIKLFQALEQKESCNRQFDRLRRTKFERCIDYWLTQGITALGKLIIKLETWETKKATAPKEPGQSYQPKREALALPPPPDPVPPPVLAEHVAIWESAKGQLRDQMTGATFGTLFKDAEPIERENGTFELRVKASALEMIEHRPKVKANILTALQAVKPEIHDVDFKELRL